MGVAGLASAHLLIDAVGARTWSAVVVTQAIGAISGALSFLGWQSAGPSLVAMQRANPIGVLKQSIRPRAIAFIALLPFTVIAVFAITRTTSLALALLAVASALPSLGCSWYFIGLAQPGRLLRLDTLPQAAGMLGGALFAGHTKSLYPFVIGIVVGALIAPTLSYASALRPRLTRKLQSEWKGVEVPIASGVLRHAAWSSWAGLITSYSPLLFAAALLPALLPVVALADRLFRFALAGFSPVLQSIQSWVPEATSSLGIARRARAAVLGAAVWGAIGGVVGALTLSSLGDALSSGAISIPSGLAIAYGVMYAVLSVGQVTALAVLVPLGETRTIAWSTALGAAIVVSFVPILTQVAGLPGLMSAVLVGETCAVTIQVVRVIRSTQGLGGETVGLRSAPPPGGTPT